MSPNRKRCCDGTMAERRDCFVDCLATWMACENSNKTPETAESDVLHWSSLPPALRVSADRGRWQFRATHRVPRAPSPSCLRASLRTWVSLPQPWPSPSQSAPPACDRQCICHKEKQHFNSIFTINVQSTGCEQDLIKCEKAKLKIRQKFTFLFFVSFLIFAFEKIDNTYAQFQRTLSQCRF